MRNLWIGSLVLFVSYLVAQTPSGHTDVRFDARRIRLGTFRYSDSLKGRVVGESSIRVRRLEAGDKYVFSNVVDGVLDQRWTAVITSDFNPVSAELTFAGR